MKEPSLRFRNFTDDWNEILLQSCCEIGTGKKDTKDKVENGIYPFFVRSDKVETINTFSFDGEAILTSGDGVGVGKNFHYIKGKFDYHQRVYCLRNFQRNFYGRYIYYYFSENFYRRVYRLSAKNSVDSVRMEMISKMTLPYPSLPEQQKIASFLSAVDKRIELLQRKKDLLEDYKKGVMQKLFSQQIRFKDENGNDFPDWEEKKVSEVFRVTRGNVLSVNKMKRTKDDEYYYPVYSSQTKDDGLTGYFNEYLYSNAITWTTDGANAGEVKFRKGKFYCTNVCGVLLSEDGQANNCISEMLNAISRKYVSYVGNPKLMNGTMASIKINFPSVHEQQKIASFLSAVDTKIETINQQIEGMQSFKKGLLQQMFV